MNGHLAGKTWRVWYIGVRKMAEEKQTDRNQEKSMICRNLRGK